MWSSSEELLKSQKLIEKIIFDLPTPIFIVNEKKGIVYQNYLSYRLIPKGKIND